MTRAEHPTLVHATAVSFGSTGALILGQSGSGKSSLALQMMALGATLVADDQVKLEPKDDGLLMSAPDRLKGQIEARHLGILTAHAEPAWARLVVDLDQVEIARLPPPRETVIAGIPIKRLHRVESPAFPSMLCLLLQGGLV